MRISRQSIEKVLYRRLIRIMLRILTLVVILLLPLCSLSSLSEAKVTGEEIYNKTLESTQIYNDTQLQEYIRNLGEEIVAVSEMPNEKFIFTLLCCCYFSISFPAIYDAINTKETKSYCRSHW